MGLFGGQTKAEGRAESPVVLDTPAEPVEDMPSLPKPRNNTVIAKGITVSGALHGEGVVQVEGTVEGEIELKGSIVVTTTGCIKGPITTDVVRIAGRVEGNITAHDHLRLEKTGNVEGDVTTASLVVEDGGRLNGRSTMVKAAQEPARPVSTLPLEDLQFGPNYKVGADEEESTADS